MIFEKALLSSSLREVIVTNGITLHKSLSLEELRTIVNDYMFYYNNKHKQWNIKKLPPVHYREQLLLSVS